MFPDDAVGRGRFVLFMFFVIIAAFSFAVFAFWYLPVQKFGPEPVKEFYKYAAVAVFIFILVDLLFLEPRRDRKTLP